MRETVNQTHVADILNMALFDSTEDSALCFHQKDPEPLGSGGAGRYLVAALLSPYAILFPAMAALFAAVTQTWWVFVIGLAMETVAISMFPRMAWFRKLVDQKKREEEKAAMDEKRATVRVQIGERHRKPLEQLEAQVRDIRARARSGGPHTLNLLDESLGLSRLPVAFVRLALASRARRQRLQSTNPETLTRRLDDFERVSSTCPSTSLWKTALRLRADNLERLAREVETIEVLMAAIQEYVCFLDECCVPNIPEDLPDRIDEYLGQCHPSLLEQFEHAA